VIVGGGVSANKHLRENLVDMLAETGIDLRFPDLSLTGDNAAMIGAAAYFRARAGKFVDPLTLAAEPNAKL
jgi:N6-L-threonylcarbamoyladenine synthase